MKGLCECCLQFFSDDEGLTVVEYVVGAALLVVAVGVVMSALGSSLNEKNTSIISDI